MRTHLLPGIGLVLLPACAGTGLQDPAPPDEELLSPMSARTLVARGDLSHENRNPMTLDDRTQATLVTARSAWLQAEVLTAHDLHAAPTTGGADTLAVGLFPHVAFRPLPDSRVGLTVRIGPYVQYLEQEFTEPTPGDFDHYTAGGMLEVEPRLDIVREDPVRFGVFGVARGGFGRTGIHVETPTVDDTFYTHLGAVGLEGGVRLNVGSFEADAGYLYRQDVFDETGVRQGLSVAESEFVFEGVFVSLGYRW